YARPALADPCPLARSAWRHRQNPLSSGPGSDRPIAADPLRRGRGPAALGSGASAPRVRLCARLSSPRSCAPAQGFDVPPLPAPRALLAALCSGREALETDARRGAAPPLVSAPSAFCTSLLSEPAGRAIRAAFPAP